MTMTFPDPGRLQVLDDDEACAADILEVLRLVASGRSRGPVRVVISSWWVGPRMPPPVTDRKRGKATRSGAWPHSPAAIAATVIANAVAGAPKLVAEHVTLIGDLVEDVLRDVRSLTPRMLADRLHAEHRFAVITPEEDQRLTAVGLEQAMPAGWRPGDNPWARYVAAGLDPLTFRPLPDDIAAVASRLTTPDGRRSLRRRLGQAEEVADATAVVTLTSDDLDRD
jgi:hypothetical protein